MTRAYQRQYSKGFYLKELKGELQVVWIHGVDAVLGPLWGLQCIPTFRLRVARLVSIGTDHADLQSSGFVTWCRTERILFIVSFLLYTLQCQLDSVQISTFKKNLAISSYRDLIILKALCISFLSIYARFLLHLANRSSNSSTVMIHWSCPFRGELSLGGGYQIRHSLPEARLLVFLLGDGHRRRLRIVQTQANLCLARQPARVNTFHLICSKIKRRTQTGSVWWQHVATVAPMTADHRTDVSDTSRRKTTVCLVLMNDLETSAVQNRGSDYNAVYREVSSPEGLSTWVSSLLWKYCYLLELYCKPAYSY